LISDKDFEREERELGLSAKLYTNKCPPRAFVPRKVSFSFKKKDEEKVRDLIQSYALQAHIDTPSNGESGFGSVQVNEGHEWFWIDILESSGLFDSVARRGYTCPQSVDTTVGLLHPQTTLASPTANVGAIAAGMPPLQEAFNHIAAKFPNPAQVNVMQSGPNLLKLEVIDFKDRVLPGRGFWERLEIYLVQLQPSSPDSEVSIAAIVDGYFATGVGDNPPALSAYQSMEQQYYVELIRFTKIFFAN